MSLHQSIEPRPYLWVGVGGNMYATCTDKQPLIEICTKIEKSNRSIYFSKKYKCWAIRCKSKIHKKRLSKAILG